jgi:hypothetical protein
MQLSNPIASGQPGVGVFSGVAGTITEVDIGPYDSVAPLAFNQATVNTSPVQTYLAMRWQPQLDDPNGTGIWRYDISRADQGNQFQFIASTTAPNYIDYTVIPSSQYRYQICALDYHHNSTCSSTISVVTSPAGSVDPRQVGVRPTGSYYGAAGEEIDMRSGNLNYSRALFKAMGRGGWGVPFGLSYNSQIWHQDANGASWLDGQDLGYGLGWKLQAGALTPVYSNAWTILYYLFVDSTGAEYHLDQHGQDHNVPAHDVYSTKESLYLWFDATDNRLYFRDGSFWVLGCTSAGTEQDAGTMYPTLMQDTNGNQVIVNYTTGVGANWVNSSSRIQSVEDVRSSAATFPVYSFTYTGAASPTIPRLTGITNWIGTAEAYSFAQNTGGLVSPFNSAVTFASVNFLSSIQQTPTNLTTSFTYDASGTGELYQVTTPYQGYIRWTYRSATLNGQRTVREMYQRFVGTGQGSQMQYSLERYPGDSNYSIHLYGQMMDYNANASKVWWFQTSTTQPEAGLQTKYQGRNGTTSPTVLTENDYTWTVDSAGNPYIQATVTIDGTAQKRVAQTLDGYGNITEMDVYDYPSGSSLSRKYLSTYLTDTAHTYRYILNRLVNTTVWDASHTTSAALVQNTYDPSVIQDVPGMRQHDPNYHGNYLTRGNVACQTTPTSSSCMSYDSGGNVLSTTTNTAVQNKRGNSGPR